MALLTIITLISVIFFLFFFVKVSCEEATTRYPIPSYYGSRDQDFEVLGFILQSNFSSFYWLHGIDMDDSGVISSSNIYYYIDSNDQEIKMMTSSDNVVTSLASTSGGFHDGHLSTALFNSPKALAFVRLNKLDAIKQRYREIVVLKENSLACKASPKSCANTSLNSTVDLNLLYEVFPTTISPAPDASEFESQKLIVADTLNHCIRQIDLISKIVTTIAGICTQKGFKDGPIGTNLLSAPTSLGIDSQGIIFFYDGVSDYIRMVDPVTTFVSTLLKGACRLDTRYSQQLIMDSLTKKRVICYKNWLNINGPQGHKYTENLRSICQLQQSLCPSTTTTST